MNRNRDKVKKGKELALKANLVVDKLKKNKNNKNNQIEKKYTFI